MYKHLMKTISSELIQLLTARVGENCCEYHLQDVKRALISHPKLKFIGYGLSSAVASHNDYPDIVIKFSSNMIDPWINYAEYTSAHKNNVHYMKVYETFFNDYVYIAIIEKLKPIMNFSYSLLSNGITFQDFGEIHDRVLATYFEDIENFMPNCKQYTFFEMYREFKYIHDWPANVLRHYIPMMESFRKCVKDLGSRPDFHAGNLMFRDSTLVLVDPVY